MQLKRSFHHLDEVKAMAYMTYRGPADLVLYQGERACELRDVTVAFEQTHTATFTLSFLPDRTERLTCTEVRITLPDGWVEYGRVTYYPPSALCFPQQMNGEYLGASCKSEDPGTLSGRANENRGRSPCHFCKVTSVVRS